MISTRRHFALLALAVSLFGFLAHGRTASAATEERRLTLALAGTNQVGLHERFEFVIGWDQAYANPYDSDEVEVNLEVSEPDGGKVIVPAFFHQACEWRQPEGGRRRNDWIYPVGQPGWRVRFTPETEGAYTAVAVLKDGSGSWQSQTVNFRGRPGPDKGCVRVSPRDPRFFAFGDGTPFFPIGQNVAFIGAGQYLNTTRAGEVFRKMGDNGANFARVWVGAEDWALGIEARKSAWGRSWSWNPPFAPMPGRDGYHANELCVQLGGANPAKATLSPTRPIALRADTKYTLSGRALTDAGTELQIDLSGSENIKAIRSEKQDQWTRFQRPFLTGAEQWWLGNVTFRTEGKGSIWLRDLSLREAGGGPELLDEANPRLAPRGVYNQIDSAMLDRLVERAEQHGIYLQLCLLTRDHYLHDLRDPASAAYQRATDDARKLLRYAVARWGYSTHVFAWEYFNEMDPGAPTERFYRELGDYLAHVDPWHHLRTVSHWGPAPQRWVYPQLDIADLHHYLRPNAPPSWKDAVAAVLDRAALLRRQAPNKPALLGEFGLADDRWGLSPYMKQDRDGVHFHNALWASAFSGISGTAMFWWWETLDQLNHYPQYQPLAKFLADIPFTSAQLKSVVLPTAHQARALAWLGDEGAYLWVNNPQATWWNLVVEKRPVESIRNDSISLTGLKDGAYRIQWWDTYTGQVLQEGKNMATGGTLKLPIPEFSKDLACKVTR